MSAKLPPTGILLELACGTLQHALHIAPSHPDLIWQPSDIHAETLTYGANIERPTNVRAPIYLDVLGDHWPLAQADAIYTANLLHISPPSIPGALFGGAQALQVSDVFIYGPFLVEGQETAAGNVQFDADLRRRNPEWGIRSLNDVLTTAGASGFRLLDTTPMPANNLLLHFHSA